MTNLFKQFGEIVSVRIMRPSNPVPADLRHIVDNHPDLAKVKTLQFSIDYLVGRFQKHEGSKNNPAFVSHVFHAYVYDQIYVHMAPSFGLFCDKRIMLIQRNSV